VQVDVFEFSIREVHLANNSTPDDGGFDQYCAGKDAVLYSNWHDVRTSIIISGVLGAGRFGSGVMERGGAGHGFLRVGVVGCQGAGGSCVPQSLQSPQVLAVTPIASHSGRPVSICVDFSGSSRGVVRWIVGAILQYNAPILGESCLLDLMTTRGRMAGHYLVDFICVRANDDAEAEEK